MRTEPEGGAETEGDAVARLKRGDPAGLQTLVKLHQVRAVRASYLVCHDRQLAEDIVQGAFVRAYERIEQFDSARPFGPWFMRSVLNDTIQAVTRRRTVSLDMLGRPEEAGPDALSPEEMIISAETREEVWAALRRLSPNQRAVVVMRYYLDLSDSEISSRVNAPPGTVRRRLHDARQRLRKLLPARAAGDD